ncbi:MAG TPA: flavodoxin domain-containing protein [Acidimicrobiia bacterium]|nr:flavodoxin domain-containing protein [Acidimicrobiia bacterium]
MLKIMVLYESLFGNTERVARAIADGLAQKGEVTLASFSEASVDYAEPDLIILGGPTHGWGLTRPSSRTQPGSQGYSLGVREWLEKAPQGDGRKAAAFDTRFDKPRWLTGSAAVRIGRELGKLGYHLLVAPESFFVPHTRGPLQDGEEQRARRWGAELADTLAVSLDHVV